MKGLVILLAFTIALLIVGELGARQELFRGRPVPACDLSFVGPSPCPINLFVVSQRGAVALNYMAALFGGLSSIVCSLLFMWQMIRLVKGMRNGRKSRKIAV